MSALADDLGNYLGRAAAVVLRWRKLTIAATLAAAALALWYAAHNLGVNTDTANMISATLPWRQNFNEYRDAFPARDRNLLIVIDAPSPARADQFAAKLLAELRRDPSLYHSILLQGEGEFFERNGLLYLPLAGLEQLSDRLAAAQPLLGLLKARFDGAAVLDVATRTLEARPDGGATDAAALAPFYAAVARTLDGARAGEPEPLAWNALLASGPEPSSRRLVVLQPALDFTRMQPATEAIAGIREIVARLNAAEPAPVTVRLSGSVAMEHEELSSVTRGATFAGIATLFMVVLVLYVALRSWRLLVISVLTLFVGLSLTAAFAAAAVGHLNLLSIAFVVLNVGLGSDYVIHVLLRHRELLAEGHAVEPALIETLRGVGSSLVLCAVTTAAGFYSFIPTTFQGVSELGLIAGTGVFFGLLVSVTLLPALVAQFAPSLTVRSARTLIDPKIFVPFNRRPRLVLGATAVVIVAACASLPWLTFDSNPIHLRDPNSESVTTLLELAANGEAQMLNLAAVAPDHDTALGWAARLRELPEVRNVITVESLVPKDQQEKVAVLEDLGLLMGPTFAELTRAPPDPQRLAGSLATLETASAGRPEALGLHAAAASVRTSLAAEQPADAERRLRELDGALTSGLPGELGRLAAGLRAQPFGREALPEPVAARFVGTQGRELVEIVPAEDVSDNAAARRFITAVHGVVAKATGLPVVYQEASSTVVRAFALAMLYAFVMVTAIIWAVLRDLKDTLLVIVPLLVATTVTAALTVFIDMPLNYANIIALPLLVGIGVDNGIHVVHRMRTDTAEQLFDTSTMRAVLTSGLTTVASFGNLAFSAHVGTASMGILLALGLAVSMAFTLIVLPAWLKRADRGAPAAA
jgi:hopanoid biosynthesis associated RND transporter like protein HpnN